VDAILFSSSKAKGKGFFDKKGTRVEKSLDHAVSRIQNEFIFALDPTQSFSSTVEEFFLLSHKSFRRFEFSDQRKFGKTKTLFF
jgi:hypothetical protein